MAFAGITAEEAGAAGYEVRCGTAPYYALPQAILSGDDFGEICVIRDEKTDRLLGVQIMGTEAPELIQLCGPALSGACNSPMSSLTCGRPAATCCGRPSCILPGRKDCAWHWKKAAAVRRIF